MSSGKARIIIDESVFTRIADGSNEALQELYELTYKPVFALLLSLTQNYQDAEDLLQETYIKIKQGAHLYKPRGNPMAWMMKIAKNLFLSVKRSSDNAIPVGPDELSDEMSNEIPYDNISDVEDRMLMEQAFTVLDTDERLVITLHVINGFKFREISGILDKPLGTVLSMYNRGLKKLRKSLEVSK